MGFLEFVVWMWGITWGGICLAILVSGNKRREDNGQ